MITNAVCDLGKSRPEYEYSIVNANCVRSDKFMNYLKGKSVNKRGEKTNFHNLFTSCENCKDENFEKIPE